MELAAVYYVRMWKDLMLKLNKFENFRGGLRGTLVLGCFRDNLVTRYPDMPPTKEKEKKQQKKKRKMLFFPLGQKGDRVKPNYIARPKQAGEVTCLHYSRSHFTFIGAVIHTIY